ncbi:hypothetical protein MYX65_00780 [Acidobacteria bacterium AH-259-L09]|nr:hypothetical protein [Acidobacteria bacterium AH-259-L09]
MLKKLIFLMVFALLAQHAFAEAKFRLRPPLWVDRDDHDIPEPKEREVSEIFAILYNSWLRHLNPEYKVLLAKDAGALNVNAWDEVPDSTWFTNRMGRQSLCFQEILEGLKGEAPQPGGWRIIRINDEGYTPKFDISDEAGNRYVLKFDLPSALERNSGAERICTLIMHAAGYNVPLNTIVYFSPETLYLDHDSYYRDPVGKRRPMTQVDLDNGLNKLKSLPDGRYRGLASLLLPGKPVGRFIYRGRRKDDPNDLIPHELRRELRGLRVIASWINHVDVKDVNALDMYVTAPDGRRFVKHCFIDFGSTMGSGDFVNGPYRLGHEYIFDGPAMARAFITLGFWQRPWDVRGEIRHQEIGYYEAESFEPAKWKPNYPNLAFERMDDADAYWGAKIVTAFSDEVVQELAAAGDYSRPEVTRYVEEVLKKRRDAIGHYWLDRMTPVEELILEAGETNYRLRFRDLALERGYADANSRVYRLWAQDSKGRNLISKTELKAENGILELSKLAMPTPTASKTLPDPYGRVPLVRLLVQSNRQDGGWALPIEVIIGSGPNSPSIAVLGWSHAARVEK